MGLAALTAPGGDASAGSAAAGAGDSSEAAAAGDGSAAAAAGDRPAIVELARERVLADMQLQVRACLVKHFLMCSGPRLCSLSACMHPIANSSSAHCFSYSNRGTDPGMLLRPVALSSKLALN